VQNPIKAKRKKERKKERNKERKKDRKKASKHKRAGGIVQAVKWP
jgi:hypothetical protein